jgi:hypothetical protein
MTLGIILFGIAAGIAVVLLVALSSLMELPK